METWQILGAGIGAGLVVAQLWRRRLGSGEPGQPIVEPSQPTGEAGDGWVELDVEPLFPSSEPISREYLIDLTESSETESDRPV